MISKPVMQAKSATEAYVSSYRGVALSGAGFFGGQQGEMAFYSSDNTVSSTNNIMINGSNVGIGTSTASSKLQVSNGNLYIDTQNNGVIMRDTVDGTCHKLVITSGSLSVASIACP